MEWKPTFSFESPPWINIQKERTTKDAVRKVELAGEYAEWATNPAYSDYSRTRYRHDCYVVLDTANVLVGLNGPESWPDDRIFHFRDLELTDDNFRNRSQILERT